MRKKQTLLFIGIYNSVLAIDAETGAEVWKTKLGGTSFVNVQWDGDALFASSKGELWRLDPQTGAEVWHNKLEGMGFGPVTLASERLSSPGSGQAAATQALRNARANAAT